MCLDACTSMGRLASGLGTCTSANPVPSIWARPVLTCITKPAMSREAVSAIQLSAVLVQVSSAIDQMPC